MKLRHQHAWVERLLDEAERAVFHRFNRHGDAAVPADDHDLGVGAHGAQLAKQVEPFDVGKHQIHEDDVGTRRGDFLARLLCRGGRAHDIAFGLEQQLQKLGAVGVIFDNQNSGRHRHRLSSISFAASNVKVCAIGLAAPIPAARPVAHAHKKLYPPIGPNASSISPHRNSPLCLRLSIVCGSISDRLTPPPVTSAFL